MNGEMTTRIIKEISDSRGEKMMLNSEVVRLRTEVKRVMWDYYSEHKSNLPDYIGEFREEIIIELMKGGIVDEVFSLFGGEPFLKIA